MYKNVQSIFVTPRGYFYKILLNNKKIRIGIKEFEFLEKKLGQNSISTDKMKKIKNNLPSKSKILGQYFTEALCLKKTILKFIKNESKLILEPCVGRGDLVEYILNFKKVEFDLFEIDKTIEFLPSLKKSTIHFGDFLEQKISRKYKTIIGNPPYVKNNKHSINIYLKFINKCYELLESNGELVFIVPSNFFSLTSAGFILKKMLNNGSFTHVDFFKNSQLFKNANVNVLVFRYVKSLKVLNNGVLVNNVQKFMIQNDGIVTFHNKVIKEPQFIKIFFSVYIGLVTGCEKVFRNEKFGNIFLLTNKNEVQKYIFVKKFPTDNSALNFYLQQNKKILKNRKIRSFNENNWFEWGALSNLKVVGKNWGKNCIYVKCFTRNTKEIAFLGKVRHFSGNLILLLPKNNLCLSKVVSFLNSDFVKQSYTHGGRFQIGQKQLLNLILLHEQNETY